MAREFIPKVVTANDLVLGDVVYLRADNSWTRHHGEAELIADEVLAGSRLKSAETRRLEIVGAYLADARPGPNGPEPIHFREAFRTRGPSNYHHGKQEHV